MRCWVEHDAYPCLVAIRGLVLSFGTTTLQNELHGGIEVVYENFEVHHLGWAPRLVGPGRGLIRFLGLNIQPDTAAGIT